MTRRAVWLILLAAALVSVALLVVGVPTRVRETLPRGPADLARVRAEVGPRLERELAGKGLAWGAPVFIRIFKESRELELWLADKGTYRLLKSYPICNYSGGLGPKLAEGDGRSPEGIYEVSLGQLNPQSSFHLSFNLGFPNAYDRHHGRTGSFLMVHGRCSSIGCYAMTDPGIEEIYLLVEAALRQGQRQVPVHIFPFRMTEAALAAQASSPWGPFWRELQPIHDAFERALVPPAVEVRAGRYATR
jgi:murein L,D-transpeptidase YafK